LTSSWTCPKPGCDFKISDSNVRRLLELADKHLREHEQPSMVSDNFLEFPELL
jgi:hypothetical protein